MIWVLAAFFIMLAVGVPIGYTLGIAGVIGILQIGGTSMLAMAPQRYFAGLDLFTFLAMPLFIFAGEIMNKAGITDRLLNWSPGEREFLDALHRCGRIEAAALHDDPTLQRRIEAQPMLQWKARNVRGHNTEN